MTYGLYSLELGHSFLLNFHFNLLKDTSTFRKAYLLFVDVSLRTFASFTFDG